MVTTRQQLVTGGARRVSSGTNTRDYITVHQTGNTNAGADADAHANLQSKGNSRDASWHWTVDDHEAVQSYQDTARCWHAGSGNSSSIAVEHCINSDGDYAATLRNGAQLVARLADKYDIPRSRIVQHHHWTGKDCPTQLRDAKGGISWSEYLDMVDRYRGSSSGSATLAALTVDGKWGTSTTTEVQRDLKGLGYYGGVIDGVIDSQPSSRRAANPGLTTGWKWASTSTGSKTIKALQQLLNDAIGAGLKVDGKIGPATIRALQTYLRKHTAYDGAVDGELWKPSTAVEALQRLLNTTKGLTK